MVDPIAPTIRLCGTSRGALCDQLEKSAQALRLASDVLSDGAPNARDYVSDEDFRRATREYSDRQARIQSVYAEIQAIYEKIAD